MSFFREHLWIRHKQAGGLRLLEPNRTQLSVLSAIAEQEAENAPVRIICLKPRQTGISTITQAEVFRRILFGRNLDAITIAHDKATSERIFGMSKVFYENLPDWLRPRLTKSNVRELVFGGEERRVGRKSHIPIDPTLRDAGCRIAVHTAGHKDAAAGTSAQILHCSEVGRWENAEELLSAVEPTVPMIPESMIIYESTGERAGRFFYKAWHQAVAGDSIYKPVFFPWFMHPDYRDDPGGEKLHKADLLSEERMLVELGADHSNIAWRREMLRNPAYADQRIFKSQYPATMDEAFTIIGSTTFEPGVLLRLREGVTNPKTTGTITPDGRVAPLIGGTLRVWSDPEPGCDYDIGVDSAWGHEDGDYSVVQVVKRGTYEQVAEFRDHVEPGVLGRTAEAIGRRYNTAQICVEINHAGGGSYINEELKRTYPNLYRWRHRDKIGAGITKSTGWTMTNRWKKQLISTATVIFNEYPSIVRSDQLQSELENFIDYGERWEAAYDNYDDSVIAFLLALQASDDMNYSRKGFFNNEPEPKKKVIYQPWQVDNWSPEGGEGGKNSWLED